MRILQVIGLMMLLTLGCAAQAPGLDFMLDGADMPALYAGSGILGVAPPDSTIHSAKELFKRVKKLPRGSRLSWVGGRMVDENGDPILMSPGVLTLLRTLCDERGITLVVRWQGYPDWSISPIL